MNEVEAEAVLVALGEPLNWSYGYAYEKGREGGDFTYYLRATATGAHADFYKGSGGLTDTVWFDSLQKAKAACERHHATGKWEY